MQKKRRMLISLVIPIYKVENYISNCLQSVMSQTFGNFECILVDDNSPDKSLEIAQQMVSSYQGNIQFRILHQDINKGVSASRNLGVLHATGEYILFLDSDDTIYERCIEIMTSLLERYPKVDLIQCGVFDDKRKNYDTTKLPVYCNESNLIFKEMLHLHIPWYVHGKLVRRQYLIDNNLFFDNDIPIHEDLYWCYLACQNANSFASSQEVVYYYNTNNLDSVMYKSDKNVELSVHFYLLIINRLFLNSDSIANIDNRLFLENILFYVGSKIDQNNDISFESYNEYKKLKKLFIKNAWSALNFPELLFLAHLNPPLHCLLNVSMYRRRMYLYEKLVLLYDKLF